MELDTLRSLTGYPVSCQSCLGMYQDTVSLLQPTVVTLRACGVCPSALRRYYIPTTTKVYSFFLASIFVAFGFDSYFKFVRRYTGITAFLTTVSLIVDTCRHCVLILSAFLSCELLLKFFRIIESAQRSLNMLNIKQPPSPTKASQIVWLVLLFTPKLLAFVFNIASNLYIIGATLLANAMVVTGTACKLRVLLVVVSGKLELLNWHLDDLNNRWPMFLPRPADVSFREFTCVREWRKTKFILEGADTRSVTSEKIRNFNKAHLKLIYAYKTLNSVFSTAVLFYIITGVINLSVYIPICLNLKSFTANALTLGTYIVGEVMALVTVLSAASKVQEEAERTALLVHDLLDEDCHSPEVEKELEKFSMALLHRKTNFTAAGFFDVNLKLVARMAGILAPIILFMVQVVHKQLLSLP